MRCVLTNKLQFRGTAKKGGGGQGTIIISKKQRRITYEYLTIENGKAKFTKASSVEREF